MTSPNVFNCKLINLKTLIFIVFIFLSIFSCPIHDIILLLLSDFILTNNLAPIINILKNKLSIFCSLILNRLNDLKLLIKKNSKEFENISFNFK